MCRISIFSYSIILRAVAQSEEALPIAFIGVLCLDHALAKQAFHFSRVGGLVPDMSGNDEMLTCLLSGEHNLLYRPNTRPKCLHHIP